MTKLRAFTMPKWGIEMTEGVVAEWMVEEGKPFKKGDMIALVETDKITNELEAEYDGMFPQLVAETGQSYAVGDLIAVVVDADQVPEVADVAAFVEGFIPVDGGKAPGAVPKKKKTETTETPVSVVQVTEKITISDSVNISPAARTLAEERAVDVSDMVGSGKAGRITFQDVLQKSLPPIAVGGGDPANIVPESLQVDGFYASPLAKRLAVLHAVDLSKITGTGPRGRICKADVLALVPDDIPVPAEKSAPAMEFSRPAAGTSHVVMMSPMRKAIAKSLSHSKSTIPHFYLRQKVRIDALLGLRAQAKAATGAAPSINDYIIRACALALIQNPDVNVQVHGDEIHCFGAADISVAVATDKGLITPIVKGADSLSVAAISREVKTLAEKARTGKLQADEFIGGSFSISNLGMFGIDQFDAIINPPQGAILAVGAGTRQPIEIGNALGFATVIELSLSCDHRAIDGAVGAQFMKSLKELLETPTLLTA